MKTIFQRLSVAFFALAMVALAGCASNGMIKSTSLGGGDKVFASAVVRVDRLVTKTSELEGTIYELDAVQVGFKEPDGKWVTYFDKDLKREVPAISRFHRETKTTPFGQTVTLTLVSGTVPAIVQSEAAKKIAKSASCKEGAICDSNVTINDIQTIATGGVGVGGAASSNSGAVAGAQSGQETNVNVSGGGSKPCVDCYKKPSSGL